MFSQKQIREGEKFIGNLLATTANGITEIFASVGLTTPLVTCENIVAEKEIEITDVGAGLVLASPDGTKYRLTVPNGGASVTITAV